jgi:hypothetical protein
MADAPSPITSPPAVPGQPWDATSDATVSGWKNIDVNSGPAGPDGVATGEFPDDGAPVWKQT